MCSVEQCSRPAIAKGLCNMHYQRIRSNGDTNSKGPQACTFDGCDRRPESRGRCYEHPPLSCGVADCDARVKSYGWCNAHYQRWATNGTPRSIRKPARPRGTCAFNGCEDKESTRGLCPGHYHQLRSGVPLKPKRGQLPARSCDFKGCGRKHSRRGWCSAHARQALTGKPMHPIGERPKKHRLVTQNGYVLLYKPDHPNARPSGWIFEHVFVMANHLSRKLTKAENVHHVNGDRTDNRLENLELWNTHQPKGQRVDQKVEWALSILRQYKPDALRGA